MLWVKLGAVLVTVMGAGLPDESTATAATVSAAPASDAPTAAPAAEAPKPARRPMRPATAPLNPRLERPRVLLPLVAAAGLGVGGGVLYGKAGRIHQRLEAGEFHNRAQVSEALDSGRRSQALALALWGAAGASLGLATWLYFTPLESKAAPRVSLAPCGGGAMASLQGVLP